MIKKNFRNPALCFANRGGGRCAILLAKHCDDCSFYKTSEQYRKDRQKYKPLEEQWLADHASPQTFGRLHNDLGPIRKENK